MKRLMLLATAACMVALLQAPAWAQDDEEEEEQLKREMERNRQELRESQRKLEREFREMRDKAREIRIRHSGRKSNDVLVLRYSPDGKLIAVTDNGKIISEKDLSKYNIRLEEALGARDIEDLRPDLERLEEIIESRRRTDEEKIAALKEVIKELEKKESDTAVLAREMYLGQLNLLGSDHFVYKLPYAGFQYFPFDENGERMTIRIRDDGCYLNGKKLPTDLCDRLLELRKELKESDVPGERWKQPESPEPPAAPEKPESKDH